MLWSDNWGWAWTAMIIAMAGFWVMVVWAVAAPRNDDSCAVSGHRVGATRRAWGRRGDSCRPPRRD